jgi:nucleolar protein 56
MTDGESPPTGQESGGWFEGLDAGDADAARRRIEEGRADEPADWPARAVESGFAADERAYYDRLREATIDAAREAVAERERADDRQLVHAVRSMDGMGRILL